MLSNSNIPLLSEHPDSLIFNYSANFFAFQSIVFWDCFAIKIKLTSWISVKNLLQLSRKVIMTIYFILQHTINLTFLRCLGTELDLIYIQKNKKICWVGRRTEENISQSDLFEKFLPTVLLPKHYHLVILGFAWK